MRFELVQHIASPADAVAATYAEPAFYATLVGLPKLATPEVQSHERDGARVHLRIRHQFIGELSSAVRAVIDPRKLSWIEDSTHDLATRHVTFRMDADHYADRFRCSGSYDFESTSDSAATVRRSTGDLSLRVRLVARRVEQAILSGLQEHLDAEAPLVERWIAEHSS
ncbi:MAG TPA: DUF2505 family protein [Acidimicrobiales bacterium]